PCRRASTRETVARATTNAVAAARSSPRLRVMRRILPRLTRTREKFRVCPELTSSRIEVRLDELRGNLRHHHDMTAPSPFKQVRVGVVRAISTALVLAATCL